MKIMYQFRIEMQEINKIKLLNFAFLQEVSFFDSVNIDCFLHVMRQA